METYKKIEKIINEWIQPMLDKKIEEDGRWSQIAWKGGHHWELSADRFTIPRLLTLDMINTHIRILISNIKRFDASETNGFAQRDNSEVIRITKTDISFNEECKFDHFSHDEMYDLYERIKAELKPESEVYHLMNENITKVKMKDCKMMNKKHIKEKTTYEFDIDSFEKNQAYQITLPTIGLEQSTYIGILVYVDLDMISFIVTNDLDGDRVICDCGEYGHITINIDEYMKGNISILKLGVVEPNE